MVRCEELIDVEAERDLTDEEIKRISDRADAQIRVYFQPQLAMN
jgi:hypothetical protein